MDFIRSVSGAVRVGTVLILTVALLCPLVGMVFVFRASDRLPGVPARVDVLWGPAIPRGREERLPGLLTMTLAAVPSLKAPAWTGVVTRTAPLGTTVKEGRPLVVINGIERPVCASNTPLFRPLTLADVGDDVLQLRHCLQVITGDAIKAKGSPRRVDADLTRQIQVASEVIGAGRSSQVGWKLASLDASVNSAAPSQGAVIAKGVAGVASAVASVVNDNQSSLRAALESGASASFEVGKTAVQLDAEGRPDAAGLVAAGPDLKAHASKGDTAGSDATASSGGGAAVDNTAGTGSSSTNTVTVTGAIVLRGTEGLQFPITAVATSATGKSCVFVRRTGVISAVTVRVVPISIGSVIVSGQIAQDDVVAYNAADVTGPGCSQ
jgi:hypothetical protein